MRKSKKPRVKRLPMEAMYGVLQRFWKLVGFGLVSSAIIHIADKRVTDMGHVNADLMRTACFKPAFNQRSKGSSIFCGANFSIVE